MAQDWPLWLLALSGWIVGAAAAISAGMISRRLDKLDIRVSHLERDWRNRP